MPRNRSLIIAFAISLAVTIGAGFTFMGIIAALITWTIGILVLVVLLFRGLAFVLRHAGITGRARSSHPSE
jgi:hypothetical protein